MEISSTTHLVDSIQKKQQKQQSLTPTENDFLSFLIQKKQIILDEEIEKFEKGLSNNSSNEINYSFHSFGIDLSYLCNLDCTYCFQKAFRSDFANKSISIEDIDQIYQYTQWHSENIAPLPSIRYISISGGEALLPFSQPAVAHIMKTFPNAKFTLFTNGIHLEEFIHRDDVDLEKMDFFQVSLDGVFESHIARSCWKNWDNGKAIYHKIIETIKLLISQGVKVKIATVIDRTNYKQLKTFRDCLVTEGIWNHPNVQLGINPVFDHHNPLGINPQFNTADDICDMVAYIENEVPDFKRAFLPFSNMENLQSIFYRPWNQLHIPGIRDCDPQGYTPLVFAPDGNLYYCSTQGYQTRVIGSYRDSFHFDKEAVKQYKLDSFLQHNKCIVCPYRYVCRGGCWHQRLSSKTYSADRFCGFFADNSIMDNIGLFL